MSVVGLLRDSGSTWRYYRTAADMVVRWALSESNYGNVKIAEWFPDVTDKQRLLALLNTGMPFWTNRTR
jgi:hypothetical protein